MAWMIRRENLVSLGVDPENKFSFWERWGLPVKGKIQTSMTKWPALPWRSHGQRLAGQEGRGRPGAPLSYRNTIRFGVFLGSRNVELSELCAGFNVILRS